MPIREHANFNAFPLDVCPLEPLLFSVRRTMSAKGPGTATRMTLSSIMFIHSLNT